MQVLQPPGWLPPRGFSNGIAVRGTQIYLAGQVGVRPDGTLVGEGFVDQVRQALENIVAVLAEAGAGPQHVTRMTWFVTEMDAYLGQQKEIGRAYREVIGDHYPAMSLFAISGLVIPGTKVEIEATAVVPD